MSVIIVTCVIYITILFGFGRASNNTSEPSLDLFTAKFKYGLEGQIFSNSANNLLILRMNVKPHELNETEQLFLSKCLSNSLSEIRLSIRMMGFRKSFQVDSIKSPSNRNEYETEMYDKMTQHLLRYIGCGAEHKFKICFESLSKNKPEQMCYDGILSRDCNSDRYPK